MINVARDLTTQTAITYENVAIELFEPKLERPFDYVAKADLNDAEKAIAPSVHLHFSVEGAKQ